MTTDELEVTEEEAAEAAALAEALERGSTAEDPPDDAFAAAALLSFSRDGGELDATRAQSILDDVLASARPRRPEVARAPWWRWLVPVSLVAAAGAAVLLIPTSPNAVTLPVPQSELLTAQATEAAGQPSDLDERMTPYRGAVLAALEDRYR